MYSYTDFERLFVHYKLEGVPVGGKQSKIGS